MRYNGINLQLEATRMKRKTWLALMMAALLPSSSVFAVRMARLYQVEMPVVSQLSDVKEQAVKDGFLQVLIRLSGDPQVDKNPVIHEGLKKAEYYVHDYNYALETPNASEYLLRIRYEPTDVNRLLKQAKIVSWGERRPLILVWLVLKDKHNHVEIISNEAPSTIYKNMSQEGKKYGLPLIFPVMDVNEMNQVSPQDVMSFSYNTLNMAAKRYSPDALLMGDVVEYSDGAQSNWRFIMRNTQWDWQVNGRTTKALVVGVMNQLKEALIPVIPKPKRGFCPNPTLSSANH